MITTQAKTSSYRSKACFLLAFFFFTLSAVLFLNSSNASAACYWEGLGTMPEGYCPPPYYPAPSSWPSGACNSGEGYAEVHSGLCRPWICQCSSAVNGACGSANGSNPSSAPTSGLCASGTASAVSNSAVNNAWSWTCAGSGGGTTASCQTAVNTACHQDFEVKICNPNCDTYSNSCGPGYGTVKILFGSQPPSDPCRKCVSNPAVNGVCSGTAGACTAGTASGDNGSTACGTTRTWTCNGSGGGTNASCSVANPACSVNGSCGSTAGTCSSGIPGGDNNASACGTTRTWTCSGSGGGSNASCSKANPACASPVNGVCSTAPGACSLGNVASDNGQTACGTTRTWSCTGANGGSNASCSHTYPACGCVPGSTGSDENATCGAANGGTYASASAVNSAGLCLTGSSGSVSGTGPWNWTCAGVGSGTSQSCSAATSVVPVNGSCNNSVALGCSAGTAISDNGQTSCGTTRTWVCQGSGGGSNSGTCSRSNGACPVNGVCNNSTALGCSAGTAISDNGATACGTTRTWVCQGTNGGSNSGTCSIANAACGGGSCFDTCYAGCSQSFAYTPAQCTQICADSCSGGGGGGGGGCFAAGTQITLADGSTKNIEDLQINDEVLSFDKAADYNISLSPNRVTHFFKMGEKQTYVVHGTKVTGDHKLMTKDGLKPVEDLKADDLLVMEDGSTKAVGVVEKGPVEPVFNFTVENVHTYVANGMRSGNMTLFPSPPEGVYDKSYVIRNVAAGNNVVNK